MARGASSVKTRDLTRLFAAKLSGSALDARAARRLRFSLETASAVAKRGPGFDARGGFVIPYFDLAGRVDPTFFRVRYLEAPTGFAAAAEKERRYAQPAGTAPRAYLPPLLERPWRAIAADPKLGVVLTEGELKAASAAALGFPTIGLGGVYAFRSARLGIELLPELEAFEWRERRVTIIYDSDLASNPQVAQALLHLARILTDRGALVFRGFVPSGEEGAKQGLDDLIAALPRRKSRVLALTQLLAEAAPFERSRELWELNDEVAYVRATGQVVELATFITHRPDAFVSAAYANRRYVEATLDGNGKAKLAEKSLPKEWLAWPHRREVASMTYAPGQPRFVDDRLNVWPGWGVEPARGDVRPWEELLAYVFGKEDEARTWFERWVAIQVQEPGVKLFTAVVLCSVEQGTGKTFLAYALREIFGENFIQISSADLRSQFNAWGYAKQLVLGEEISGGEDKRLDADFLKSMITQLRVTVNRKYQPPFTVEDRANYLFTTNHPDAFYLEATDRRFFVHALRGGPLPRAFADRFETWAYSRAGAAALFDHLLRLGLGDFSAKAPAPMTAAKAEMAHLSRSELEAFAADLFSHPDDVLSVFGSAYLRDLWTADELLALRFPSARYTANGLARALVRAGVLRLGEGNVIQTTLGARRLYAVRNRARWARAKPREIAAAYVAALSAEVGGGTGKRYAVTEP